MIKPRSRKAKWLGKSRQQRAGCPP